MGALSTCPTELCWLLARPLWPVYVTLLFGCWIAAPVFVLAFTLPKAYQLKQAVVDDAVRKYAVTAVAFATKQARAVEEKVRVRGVSAWRWPSHVVGSDHSLTAAAWLDCSVARAWSGDAASGRGSAGCRRSVRHGWRRVALDVADAYVPGSRIRPGGLWPCVTKWFLTYVCLAVLPVDLFPAVCSYGVLATHYVPKLKLRRD